jgi:hypothetical protein
MAERMPHRAGLTWAGRALEGPGGLPAEEGKAPAGANIYIYIYACVCHGEGLGAGRAPALQGPGELLVEEVAHLALHRGVLQLRQHLRRL